MMSHSSELMIQLEETRDLRDRCVMPIYGFLLHANFVNPRHSSVANHIQIAAIAHTITDDEIAKLLEIHEWRGRLVAGWCVGLSKRSAFLEVIANLLLKSEGAYAGQGYCAALGLIGDDRCRVHLQDYLRQYLPLCGRFYDQQWAIGALDHIDEGATEPFLAPILWAEGEKSLDPLSGIRNFRQLAAFLTLHEMIAGRPTSRS